MIEICNIPDCVLLSGHKGHHKPRCMMIGCAFEYGHGGPHGMNGLDYHPELPRLTPEEEESIWNRCKIVSPETFKNKWRKGAVEEDLTNLINSLIELKGKLARA